MRSPDGDILKVLMRILTKELRFLEKGGAACCGISLPQAMAITELGVVKAVSLNELADALNVDKSTMSRTVENLVCKGYALREAHPEDRRSTVIKCTGEGEVVFKSIEEMTDDYYKRLMESIPEDKREQVIESIRLLIEAARKNECC